MTVTKPGGIERGYVVQPTSEGFRFRQPFGHGLRPMECEDFTRARLWIMPVCKPGDDTGAFIDERERLFVVDPLELGSGVTGCHQFAVREYQTDVGPADYVLFIDRRAVG